MTSPLQQKLKVTGPVVITANRLGDGAVVYRSADGSWTKDLAAAAVVTTTPAAMELLTAALSDKLEAVDAYVARRLSGELTEEEFKPLRLMNGVYLQLHAYMLRIAIPYGTLSSDQIGSYLSRGLAAPNRLVRSFPRKRKFGLSSLVCVAGFAAT